MIEPTQVRRLVVRIPNWVGDAVHSLPAVTALRRYFPAAELTILARGEVGALFLHHPAVDRVASYPRVHGVVPQLIQLWRTAADLRRQAYDLAVVLTNAFEGAWLMFLTGISRRYGYATDGRGWLLTDGVPCPPRIRSLHQADYYLALLAEMGIPATRTTERLWPTEAERRQATERLRAAGWSSDRPLIALCPGAGYGSAKRWPVERYAELAARLISRHGASIVLLGGAAERRMVPAFAAVDRAHLMDLVGETSLREAMALLAACDVAVSNDSGLLHLATAVGTPAVALFGPTDPDRTGPTTARATILRQRVLCSPCELRECPIDHRCMERISVAQVSDAAVEMVMGHGQSATTRDGVAPSTQTVAVFLDRDGTLNRDVGYLSDPDQLELCPGAGAAVRSLNEAGLRVIVVTNQSGVARGLIAHDQLEAIHRRLAVDLHESGATLDAIYYCPHHPDAQCRCRKPQAGLIEQAVGAYSVDPSRSYVIGDKLADVQLARRVGAASVLVRTGHGTRTLEAWPGDQPRPDYIADDLPSAVRWILGMIDGRHAGQDARCELPVGGHRERPDSGEAEAT
jgi:heptosyltransferase-2